MSGSTYVEKVKVTASLRSRELHNRADWVDREMPALIDTVENAALLRTLGIDLVDASFPAPAHGEVATEGERQEPVSGRGRSQVRSGAN